MSLLPLHSRTSTQPAPSRQGRVLALDLLRLCAAVLMVQGHTIDAVLQTEARVGAGHAAWMWLRGHTAVAFLLAAGFSFHLATLTDLEGHRRDRDAVLRRFRRAGGLILLGYLLHLPLAALTATDSLTAQNALDGFFAIDVLQCIGVCLAVLECLVLALPSERAVQWAAGALGALVLLLSSKLVLVAPTGSWAVLLHYVTPRGGSLFPLFPWAAHVLLGVWLAGLLLRAGARISRWAAIALLMFVAARAADLVGDALAHMHLLRLAWVLTACVALRCLEPLVISWPKWVWRVSGQTLFIYAFHVVLVYGEGVGLASLIGPSLAPPQAATLALGMIALTFALALPYARAVSALAPRGRTG